MNRRRCITLCLFAHAVILATTSPAQAKTKAPATRPAGQKAGALFQVRVNASQCAAVRSGTLAGEPLHFRKTGDTSFALAAIPIDSTKGLSLHIVCANGDSSTSRIATAAGNYRLESLRVAPAFSAKPDSALAERMRLEAEQAATVSRNAHNTPRLWSKPFIVPRATRVTSGFGSGRTFNGTVTSRHMGTDYAGAIGAPVRATNRGIVRIVGAFYLGGNVIYLDHGEGMVTAYLHLSKQLVAVGDTVQQGAVIGHVGATGRVTGPHLHFIARYGSITVDPASLYALK